MDGPRVAVLAVTTRLAPALNVPLGTTAQRQRAASTTCALMGIIVVRARPTLGARRLRNCALPVSMVTVGLRRLINFYGRIQSKLARRRIGAMARAARGTTAPLAARVPPSTSVQLDSTVTLNGPRAIIVPLGTTAPLAAQVPPSQAASAKLGSTAALARRRVRSVQLDSTVALDGAPVINVPLGTTALLPLVTTPSTCALMVLIVLRVRQTLGARRPRSCALPVGMATV